MENSKFRINIFFRKMIPKIYRKIPAKNYELIVLITVVVLT